MRRAFTLMELIVVVVIVAVLSVASFKALAALKVRTFKAKEITRLSLQTQIVLDELAQRLAARIHATVIGYDPATGSFKYISDILSNESYPVLEWIGYDEENLSLGNYSGFVDMKRSITSFSDYTLYTDISLSDLTRRALIFAAAFDRGYSGEDLDNAFGWHGKRSDAAFDITASPPHQITVTDSVKPQWIYEKYYLAKSAYAVARAADIDKSAACLQGLDVDNDTLLLFYDYRPWRGETFCADPNGSGQSGKASILMRHVAGLSVIERDYTLRVTLDINETLRGTSVGVHFSKMKVVF